MRAAHYRLSPHVEARIYDDGAARPRHEAFKEGVVERVGLTMHGLNSRRVVDVRDGRNPRSRHVELLDPEQTLLLGRHRDAVLFRDRRDQEHIRRISVKVEPLRDVLAQDARCERPETLSILDLEVHHRLHPGRTWITQDAACPQRPGAELHATLEPADDLLL